MKRPHTSTLLFIYFWAVYATFSEMLALERFPVAASDTFSSGAVYV